MPVLLVLFHVVLLVALGGLVGQALLNHATLPQLSRTPPPPRPRRVSVLIPARNEARRIGMCVRAWLAQRYPDYEVLVYDDDSADDTVRRAVAAAGRVARFRIVRGGRLPEGWRGKTYACHRLRTHARGDLLVFADVDVTPTPDALLHAVGALAALRADAISALPVHTGPTLAVRALVALQNWAALAFVPVWLSPTRRRPWLAAMNGQFIAIDAAVYDATGGFLPLRRTLAEDAALGRRLVALGYRVRLVGGGSVLACEPYARLAELWPANVRNLVPLFFDSTALLLVALAALGIVYLAPVALVALGLVFGNAGTVAWTWLPVVEIALGLSSRVITDDAVGRSSWLTVTHPLAIGVLVLIGVDAARRFTLGRPVEWRGRRYRVGRPARSRPA